MFRYFFYKIEDVYDAKADQLERGARDLYNVGNLEAVFEGKSFTEERNRDYEEASLKYNHLLYEADKLRREGRVRQKRFNLAFWTLILVSIVGLFAFLPLSFAIDAVALWTLIKH